MANKRLFTIPCLALVLALNSAWAEESVAADSERGDEPTVSNIDAWEDEPANEEESWNTWFGMGFEYRKSVMDRQGNAGTAASVPSRVGGGSKK